jgi:hypothetical protein
VTLQRKAKRTQKGPVSQRHDTHHSNGLSINFCRITEQERLEKERAQKEREAADKLASDRHREHQDALSDIKKTLVSRA